MRVAIIGAGWAGLSAATHLHGAGHQVDVFEAGHILGGRARAVYSPRLRQTIDNGQHILLGAYTQTLGLIDTLWKRQRDTESATHSLSGERDVAHSAPLLRLALNLRSADNRYALTARRFPAPFHLVAALLAARGYTWPDRRDIIRAVNRLKAAEWRTPAGMSVAQWLLHERQASHAIRHFWEPICLAALNTPIDQACAQVFATVLRDGLGGPAGHSDIIIPRVDLTSLWPALIPGGITVNTGQPIRRILRSGSRSLINGAPYDATIIATNVPSARRLLSSLYEAEWTDSSDVNSAVEALLGQLDAFRYIPLATLTLRLKSAWALPAPMLMLTDALEKKWFGQWLFNRDLFMHGDTEMSTTLINVVISDATRMQGYSTDEIVAGVIEQLQAQTRVHGPMPDVDEYELIIEKRATFACTPNLVRPSNQTPWHGIFVAGDWTDSGYPAVLEGAVRSGKQAAELIDKMRA